MLEAITASVGKETMAIIIIGFTLIMFALDRLPLSITAMLSSLALALFGCMSLGKVYAGFATTLVMLVFGMMIVGYALFETGVVVIVGREILKSKVAQNEKMLIAVLMILVAFISAFLSNTATIATFIPLVGAMVASSNGRLKNKNILMALGMAASIGGTMTLVGSTAQPMVNSVLVQYKQPVLGMFDFAWVGVPLLVALIVYFITFGYKIQEKAFDFEDVVAEVDVSNFVNFTPNHKTYIAAGTMIFCIVCFVTEVWNMGIVALLGAGIVIVTGCVDFKKCMRSLDWNTVLLMAFAQGIAAGMNDSGAGKMIANMTVDLVGTDFWLLFSICIIITVFLTNIMSNTAVAAMMTPIYIVIASSAGYNSFVFAMGIALAANASIATPIGGTAMSQTLVAGYRFRDFVKVGLPITIILTIMTIIITPLVFGR